VRIIDGATGTVIDDDAPLEDALNPVDHPEDYAAMSRVLRRRGWCYFGGGVDRVRDREIGAAARFKLELVSISSPGAPTT
jgi:hypothetical protein